MNLAWLFRLNHILVSGFIYLFYKTCSFIKNLISNWSQVPVKNKLLKSLGTILKTLVKPNIVYSKEINDQDIEIINKNSVIAVSNHQTGVDPVFLMLVLNRAVSFLATDFYNNIPGIRYILNKMRSIFVPTVTSDTDKFKVREEIISKAVARLQNNNTIALFPYGRFHTYKTKIDNNKIRIKTGAAEIALRSQKPIVVMNLKGIPDVLLDNVFIGFLFYLFFGHYTVTTVFERVIKPEDFPNTGDKERDQIILSNMIAEHISTEYHFNPKNGKQELFVEELSTDYKQDHYSGNLGGNDKSFDTVPHAVTHVVMQTKADSISSIEDLGVKKRPVITFFYNNSFDSVTACLADCSKKSSQEFSLTRSQSCKF